MIEVPQDAIKEAIDRIARTPDGLTLYRYLQRECLRVLGDPTQKRALPVLEGRRSFAAELMAYMADGIGENDRSCVTFHRIASRTGNTGAGGAGRGIARRVSITADDANPLDTIIAEYGQPKPAAGNTNGSGSAGSSGGGDAS